MGLGLRVRLRLRLRLRRRLRVQPDDTLELEAELELGDLVARDAGGVGGAYARGRAPRDARARHLHVFAGASFGRGRSGQWSRSSLPAALRCGLRRTRGAGVRASWSPRFGSPLAEAVLRAQPTPSLTPWQSDLGHGCLRRLHDWAQRLRGWAERSHGWARRLRGCARPRSTGSQADCPRRWLRLHLHLRQLSVGAVPC